MSKIAAFKHRVVLLPVSASYTPGAKHDDKSTYEATRGIWRIAQWRLGKIEYALGIVNRSVVSVFKPKEWHPALTTEYRIRKFPLSERPKTWKTRCEFTGKIAPPEILRLYLNKSVDDHLPRRHQNHIYGGNW